MHLNQTIKLLTLQNVVIVTGHTFPTVRQVGLEPLFIKNSKSSVTLESMVYHSLLYAA